MVISAHRLVIRAQALMSGNSNNVGIFWDYENVGQGASQSSGFAIANRIRSLAYAYGRVTLFKAYLELQVSTTSSKAATFRSELQCSGVSLTDCPHNNRKEGASSSFDTGRYDMGPADIFCSRG